MKKSQVGTQTVLMTIQNLTRDCMEQPIRVVLDQNNHIKDSHVFDNKVKTHPF
jgi:riboflavin biosynthesis pyrimidine reductase